jgi:type IV pilus assembly protein PilM
MKLGLGVRSWAGLDIGTYSVKLVTVPPGGGRCRYADAVIPRLGSGEEHPAPALLAGLIDDCMTRIQLSPRGLRGLSIGVSGSDVIVKQVPLPWMDESEVAGALRFEAKKHLPFDVQQMVLDHQVLGRHPVERRLDVLLATVSQQRLERMLAPLRELGIEADIVDAAPLALSNALTHWFGREPAGDGEVRLLLDLGHRGSWLTLRQKSQPFFARRLDWGGAQLTQAIAASLDGSLERADAWKLDAGSSLAQESPEAFAAVRALERLTEEVRRSVAYYGTLAPLPANLTLHVCGGTTRLAGLTEQLSGQLGMPVAVFSPLDTGESRLHAHAGGPQYAQAYGLALRAA